MPKPFPPAMQSADSADSAEKAVEAERLQNVEEAVEAERLRLAQDLHDDLGGRLMALKMALAPLLQPASDAARRADKLLDEAVDAMHGALRRLRPPELDMGLVAALQQLADDFTSPTLSCRFSSNQSEIDAAPAVTLGLLRICREALANIARHAGARQADIRLTQTDAGGEAGESAMLLLDIADDGCGYAADAPDSASIAHRVRSLDGVLERHAGPPGTAGGNGCHLHIRVPMARSAAVETARIVR
ncbi:hypothetical protein D9O50_17340 [Oxalobacteraceae bacterium CAVE-383]|nr:hypothetical protein D9O50_17340 [Oxalobacteraceae bacterium CAVE-383]